MSYSKSLIKRVIRLENQIKNIRRKRFMKYEAVPTIAVNAAKVIVKNLPSILKTFKAIKDALSRDSDTELNEDRKKLLDNVSKIIELIEEITKPMTIISRNEEE